MKHKLKERESESVQQITNVQLVQMLVMLTPQKKKKKGKNFILILCKYTVEFLIGNE